MPRMRSVCSSSGARRSPGTMMMQSRSSDASVTWGGNWRRRCSASCNSSTPRSTRTSRYRRGTDMTRSGGQRDWSRGRPGRSGARGLDGPRPVGFRFPGCPDSLTSRMRPMAGPRMSSERRARDASTQEKEVEDEGPKPHGSRLEAGCSVGERLPALQQLEVAPHRVWQLRLVQGSRRSRRWLSRPRAHPCCPSRLTR